MFSPDGTPRSSFDFRGGVRAIAEGDNGIIYIGSSNIHVYALNPDGTVRWESRTQASVRAITIARNGLIYAGSGKSVYAFAPNDGALKWKFALGTMDKAVDVVSLVMGRGDILYVGSIDHNVYAIDPIESRIKWSFKARGTPFALAEGHDGTIYVGSYDGNIYALDAEGGKLRWRFSTGTGEWGRNAVHAIAVGNDKIIYAGSGTAVEAISLSR